MKSPLALNVREWRGNRKTNLDAYRKYDFPVTVRRVDDDDKQPETTNR